jgi:4-phospho-D-threonate 3-dehydrogenase / 4-phospho-D-erythronate 3-dehydrogenase
MPTPSGVQSARPIWVGISLGDITGVGPEVALKAVESFQDRNDVTFTLIGDRPRTDDLISQLGLRLRPGTVRTGEVQPRVVLEHFPSIPAGCRLLPQAPEASLAALCWLRRGAELALEGTIDALVTAPVSKEAIIRAGQSFVGQTEYLSDLARASRTAMMLLGHDPQGRWLRVALATTHLPLKSVSAALTIDGIRQSIELASEACELLGLPSKRVAVCGLNPHAGEGGKMGMEELELIAPAVREAQNAGIQVEGPFAADTLFHRVYRGDFEAVVAMYHDQGLVPLKMVAFDSGVNWTLGLPFIRTSPDHGTAYDIAGTGKANPSSMRSAIELAVQLAKRKREITLPSGVEQSLSRPAFDFGT